MGGEFSYLSITGQKSTKQAPPFVDTVGDSIYKNSVQMFNSV